MTKEVICPPCGESIRAESDDEIVARVMDHAKVHGHELDEGNRAEILATVHEV